MVLKRLRIAERTSFGLEGTTSKTGRYPFLVCTPRFFVFHFIDMVHVEVVILTIAALSVGSITKQ